MEENTDSFEDLKTVKKIVAEMNLNLTKIASNQPKVILDSQEISKEVIKYLPDFQLINGKIDSIPKTIDARINWVTFPMKGWRMLAFWFVFTLCTVAAANYKILWMHYEKVQIIKSYEEQIKKLKEKNPETAKKYFPND